jgi:hypothetical protein
MAGRLTVPSPGPGPELISQPKHRGTCSLMVLSSEMDLAEKWYYSKAFVKGKGVEIGSKFLPSPALGETFPRFRGLLVQLVAISFLTPNAAENSLRRRNINSEKLVVCCCRRFNYASYASYINQYSG